MTSVLTRIRSLFLPLYSPGGSWWITPGFVTTAEGANSRTRYLPGDSSSATANRSYSTPPLRQFSNTAYDRFFQSRKCPIAIPGHRSPPRDSQVFRSSAPRSASITICQAGNRSLNNFRTSDGKSPSPHGSTTTMDVRNVDSMTTLNSRCATKIISGRRMRPPMAKHRQGRL
jgi:hypothetical protein